MMKLKIGKIAYSNLFPIFYALERGCDCSGYEFTEGVPSDLNRMMRRGELDICPSSSIEYLRNRSGYDLMENHSISSFGPIGSILLFSRVPIDALNGAKVLTSSQSETSVALIQIILGKFLELDCVFIPSSEPLQHALKSHPAYLLIGDDALTEALKWPKLHIYDAGDLWYKHTGLPFTFALWMVRKDCCVGKIGLLERFRHDLQKAKTLALGSFDAAAGASPLRDLLSAEGLVSYWKGISYDFGPEHQKGFDLFRRYAEELGLIQGH